LFFRCFKKGGQASKKIQNTHISLSLTQWLTKPHWECECVFLCVRQWVSVCSFSGTSLSFTHLFFLYLYLHVFLERNNENEASSYASHAPPYSPQTHLDSCLCIPSCSLSSSSTIFSISHFNVCFLSRFYENSYFFFWFIFWFFAFIFFGDNHVWRTVTY